MATNMAATGNVIAAIRGNMVPIPGGTLKVPKHAGGPFDAVIKPFRMGDAPVINAAWRTYSQVSANYRFGSILFRPNGSVHHVVRGENVSAVRNATAGALSQLRQAGEIGVYATAALELVPQPNAWEERFAYLGKAAAVFLREDHPVVHITPYEAFALADFVGCRAPTELEWHFAALGGREDAEYATDDGTLRQDNAAWGERAGGATMPVKSFGANPFGLYDLTGNAWEVMATRWVEGYAALVANPFGPFDSKFYSYRGGSWVDSPGHLRLACRGGNHPGRRNGYYGLRLVAPQDS